MKAPKKEDTIFGADGIQRTIEAERELNALAAATFSRAGPKAFLSYLKSITINFVQGPKVTDAELRHIEGQRYLVGIIERRVDLGRRRKPELPGTGRGHSTGRRSAGSS